MSADFQKVLVKDDRLNVTDQIKYAVMKGGQSVTYSQFGAVSQAPSQQVYNIQVPSEQTVLSRRVDWQSTVTVSIVATIGAGVAANINVFDYGNTAALAPFPLQNACSTIQVTINNNPVTINMQDVMAPLLRMLDREELALANGYAPNAYDIALNYSDLVGNVANVLGNGNASSDAKLYPRGAWVLDRVKVVNNATGGAATSSPLTVAGQTGTITITATFTVTEPLMVSPFIFADPKSNNQGIYGIQNLNFQMNIGSAARLFRFAQQSTGITYATTISEFSNSQLKFAFLTPHPSDLMPARNVVPYYELPRYISTNQPGIPAGSSNVYNSQSLQLNQVPDKLIIFARKSLSSQTAYDSDSFLPISNISINWNNNAGILSSATAQDLYAMSVANGSNQSWYEFSGKLNAQAVVYNSTDASGAVGAFIPMCGSVLILEMGKDIQLPEDFYAPGSLGNFNLQFRITVQNLSASTAIAANAYELVVITMNSGVFVCERGTSSTYTGILTKQDVLDASSQEPYYRSDVQRMVGGSFLDKLKSVAAKVAPKLPGIAKAVLGNVDNPYAKGASEVLGALGFAKPRRGKLADRMA